MEQHSEGLKVMVIDDSKTIRRTAETLLKKVGCEVITAVDGFDALAKIADTHPNIIFVDIMMPRLDGYQTCALIKNNSAFKSTPVIMLSSRTACSTRPRVASSVPTSTSPSPSARKNCSARSRPTCLISPRWNKPPEVRPSWLEVPFRIGDKHGSYSDC